MNEWMNSVEREKWDFCMLMILWHDALTLTTRVIFLHHAAAVTKLMSEITIFESSIAIVASDVIQCTMQNDKIKKKKEKVSVRVFKGDAMQMYHSTKGNVYEHWAIYIWQPND